jgi:hypothetical protein
MKLQITPWVGIASENSDYVLKCIVSIEIDGRLRIGRVVAKSKADGWDEKAKRRAIIKRARELLTDALYEEYPELFQ